MKQGYSKNENVWSRFLLLALVRVGGTAAPGRALENALQGQVLVRVRGERGVRAAPGANRVVVQSDTVAPPHGSALLVSPLPRAATRS